jgi:hypothetical protein
MSKLYIFAIGGTGSRVLKSLTMLLAAGVRPSNQYSTIVPMIIDPDVSAYDLTRAVADMTLYKGIRLSCDGSPKGFFNTKIVDCIGGFRIPISNTQNIIFSNFINYDTLNLENQALASILFSSKNLNSNMDEGFKGNPNIGSVVLNQFANSQEFKAFASSFQSGDKIFIISSIFGGTGASGFPLLLKTLRTDQTLPNYGLRQSAQIGAMTVMPYFHVKQNGKSEIDSSTFMSKTKAALSYYEKNMSAGLDALYYIGDEECKDYENHEGSVDQKDDAHLVEMVAALGVLDFTYFNKVQGAPSPIYKEFGLQRVNQLKAVDFHDFYSPNTNQPKTAALIGRPLTQFTLFAKYMSEVKADSMWKRQPWATKYPWSKRKCFVDDFLTTSCYNDIIKFQTAYFEWLSEMAGNVRAFAPFASKINTPDIFNIVNGFPAKKSFWYHNYSAFDNILNKYAPGALQSTADKAANINRQFIDLFYDATATLVEKKINL